MTTKTQECIARYRRGLISWDEMQSCLNKLGYELKDPYNTGRYHLLPLKGVRQ